MKNTTITRIFALLAVAAMLVAVSGCARVPGATYPTHTETISALEASSKHMYRGRVKLIAPDDMVEELIAAYDGDEARFERLLGVSFAQARARQDITIDWLRKPGLVARHNVFADRKWNLQPGDIIDYLPGQGDFSNPHPPVKAHGLCWGVGFWRVCSADLDFGQVVKTPPQVLGVVCRADEPGCRQDSSPATTIGMGRHMTDAAEYRGVEAESRQPIASDAKMTFYKFWGINACANCTDEDPSLAELAERNAAE